MTYQALTTAITGLRAAQQQLNVISNNVSNATTPGYSRQILPQETQILRESGQTVGVLTNTVIRQVDMNLQRDLWTQVSISNLKDVQIEYMQQIQNFNGPPDKEFSIAAKIAELENSFSALSDTPDSVQALESTLNQATIVADKFNDYADLITQLRNDAQSDLQSSVNRVNNLLEEITNINVQTMTAKHIGNSVAGLQDQRDIAIKSLTEELDISFFERADGALVVQTREGHELAGDEAHRLSFEGVPLGANQFYPASASGLILISTANGRETSTDITERQLGGKIGGLVELRDDILPGYTAQLDELAFQMANRLDAQGLRLYTDQNGNLPAGTAPDPNSLPDPTPVPYVDFARNMEVNKKIVNDITLLQQGTFTSDTVIPEGDNALIRRVLEFGFGDTSHQQAVGTTDLLNIGGAADLQEWLGLSSVNQVVAGIDFSSFLQLDDPLTVDQTQLIDAFSEIFPAYPVNAQFQVTYEEARLGLGPETITVDLSAASLQPGATALEQIINEVNAQLAAVDPALNASVTSNSFGQLVFESSGNITIAGSGFAGAMGDEAMASLGIQQGTFVTEDPSFTVQIGNGQQHVITIEPTDTITELEAKLTFDPATQTGIPGLFVDVDAVTGTLTLRPGIDNNNFAPTITDPVFGGDLTITSSSFGTNGAISGLPDNINVVSALFGSFTGAGVTLQERPATVSVPYQFEIANGSNTFTNFRNQNLGPNAGVTTGIFSADNILDYAQKIINAQAQDFLQAQSAFENEDTLRSIIQREFSDESGVNIDEEMSNLIVVQTAYAAAARTITAADEMFQELLNAIRR